MTPNPTPSPPRGSPIARGLLPCVSLTHGDEGDRGWDYQLQGKDWMGNETLCRGCTTQSPIHFSSDDGLEKALDKTLDVYYNTVVPTVLHHTGATLQVVPDKDKGGDMGYVVKEGVKYRVVQTHFHCPAEHTFGDDPEDRRLLEYHIVHADDTGNNLVVIGFTFSPRRDRASCTWLQELVSCEHPSKKGDSMPGPNLHMPWLFEYRSLPMYHYKGSLTTPPCTENVDWYVAKYPILLCADQLHDLRDKVFFVGNYRIQQNVKECQYNNSKIFTTKAILHKEGSLAWENEHPPKSKAEDEKEGA